MSDIENGGAPPTPNLDVLLDIELPLAFRFGTTHMTLDQLAGLDTGSLIELDRTVDQPVEILVNGRVVARGEPVDVQGSFGIRILEIAGPRERLSGAGEGVA